MASRTSGRHNQGMQLRSRGGLLHGGQGAHDDGVDKAGGALVGARPATAAEPSILNLFLPRSVVAPRASIDPHPSHRSAPLPNAGDRRRQMPAGISQERKATMPKARALGFGTKPINNRA
eukprot:7908635-Pyramimonas_sp.AAC.1